MIKLNNTNEPIIKFKNLGNNTKGPYIIAKSLSNAKQRGFTKVKYNIVNKPTNYNEPMNAILNYFGFNPMKNFTPRVFQNLSKLNDKKVQNILNGRLNNYKKYIQNHKNKYINKRLERFNKALNKNNRIIVERPKKYERKLLTKNRKAYLIITNLHKNKIHYHTGETNKNMRRKGYGTLLREIPISAARNAGYKTIAHSGIFMNNTQKKSNNNIPPSRRIVEKLGFKLMEILPFGKNPRGQYKSELNL